MWFDEMKKSRYPKGVIIGLTLWLLVLLIIASHLIGIEVGKYYNSLETCDWCREKIHGKGTQLGEYWLHDLCYSQLNVWAGYWYGNEYTNERMDWIKDLIEERK